MPDVSSLSYSTTNMHDAVGCDDCRLTGFKGREGIYEILSISDPLSVMIKPGVTPLELRGQALAEGMQPLKRSGAMKVAQGKTTLEEVLSVVPPETSSD